MKKMIAKVYRLAQEQGVTLGSLEAAAGIPQGRLSKWKNPPGKSGRTRGPTVMQALLLARALDVPLEFLADDKLDEPPLPAAGEAEFSVAERSIMYVFRALKIDEEEGIDRLLAPLSRGLARALTPPQTLRPRRRKGK